MRLLMALGLLILLGMVGIASSAPSPQFAPADVRAEFAALYARLEASHFDLYAHRPKAAYDELFRRMLTGMDRPMSDVEVRVAFQKFMAFGRVAHSRIEFPGEAFGAYRDGGGRVMPVSIRIVKGRAYVADDGSGLGLARGVEIVALNGLPMGTWLERLGAHVSADNDYMLHTLLENRFARLLWLELGAVDHFVLSLGDGRSTREVTVPARMRTEIVTALAAQPKRLELDWDARTFKMVGDVGYLRPGPFYNNDPNATNIWDVTQFRAFVDASFEALLRAKAKSVVIDLRDNPGGDNSFSDLLVSWYATKPFRFCRAFRIKVSEAAIASNAKRVVPGIDDISAKFAAAYAKRRVGDVFSFELPMAYPRTGRRFQGRVFVLINRHSYSNAVQVAALSQDYDFATILGEETSDLATTLGAMEQFELPRTRIEVGFPKAHIIRVNGDERALGVVPDVAIETPIVEPPSDVVLQRALAIAQGGR
jgi:hypothetical protein